MTKEKTAKHRSLKECEKDFRPPWSNDPNQRVKAPKDASTVILLREKESCGSIEVYMVKRHSKASFMAGLWVFPGGKVDENDYDPSLLALAGTDAMESCKARIKEAPGIPEEREDKAFALHVAALRELFEEAGVLLARKDDGSKIGSSPEWFESMNTWRERVHNRECSFTQMLKSESLVMALEDLFYVSRWITPSAEPMRFDARFFAMATPADQVPLFDNVETTAGAWKRPRDFLDAHTRGELILAPPNIRNLEDLGGYKSIENFRNAMIERQTAPILPKMLMREGRMLVVLPWDKEYDLFEGESFNPEVKPHPMAECGGPSRFILKDGRFFSVE